MAHIRVYKSGEFIGYARLEDACKVHGIDDLIAQQQLLDQGSIELGKIKLERL